MTAPQHTHGVEELCEPGNRIYAEALKQRCIRREAAGAAPCLIDLGLLHPDPDDMERLLPTPPSLALHALLRDIESEIHTRRSREVRIAETLERFIALDTPRPPEDSPGIVVLEGFPRINTAIDRATNECRTEMMCVQPGPRSEYALSTALPRDLALRERGAHMRTLYQRSSLHSPGLRDYLKQMGDSIEIRSLDDIPERLIIVDRSVAFIPASADRTTALELRHPALVEYLATVFERFWRQGIPCTNLPHPYRPRQGSPSASTPSPGSSAKDTPTKPSPNGSGSASAPAAPTSHTSPPCSAPRTGCNWASASHSPGCSTATTAVNTPEGRHPSG